jgi:hypothetical protein
MATERTSTHFIMMLSIAQQSRGSLTPPTMLVEWGIGSSKLQLDQSVIDHLLLGGSLNISVPVTVYSCDPTVTIGLTT